ncbi:Nucleolar protein [Actinidia chinensis var. chinensis]|uniref:Nucleolar protein n=1 Tax=Actinidia chinensis var. chinensis TaxID=1590841 RepID=A0A2R6RU09_ACTCC|nr:Nucleolar protein [Actinidia chinensis var. chinensis]
MSYQGGNLKSTSINGVKMYTVSGQNRSVATWLPPKKLRALRKDKDYMQRVDLIQDLRFETATSRIKATPDGEYLIASGIYPPQVKVYELRELSLKFERHLISEIINFQVLADDYSKIAFLCADRSICLHAKYGSHYSLRIPRMGRDIIYDSWSCDLICAASSPDLYRINLEQGRFLTSLNTQSPAINVVTRSKLHGLVACGGEDGAVECFDMRVRSSVGRLNAVAPAGDIDQEVTAVEFDGDGDYLMAVGSSAGKVLIYDLRSSRPMRVKDHMYGSPILNIKWHRTLNSEQPKLITTDNHIVRIWDPETGEGMTSIEPTAGTINDICVFDGSGLMLLALDCSQIPSYFVPALGPAPKWCSYLENLTEELEESAQTTIYDDFKFLTKEDLERLNLTNLIGTNLLRAYMHGFFIDYRLYKKAQALADPFAYDTYIERRKQEKLEAERASRITIKRKLPKVNRVLAARLLEDEDVETEKKDDNGADAKKTSKKKKGLSSDVLKDERFTEMFENKDFEVDEFSSEYLALHPMAAKKQPSLVEEHFEPVMEDEDQSQSHSDASTASQSSEEDRTDDKRKSKSKSRIPRLYEVKDERHADAFWNRVSLAKEDALPLGERVAALTNEQQGSRTSNSVKLGPGGSREISFVSRSSAKYKEDDEDEDGRRGKRREVPDRSGFRGRGGGGGRGRGRGEGRGRGGSRGRSRGGRGRGRR